MKAASAEGKDPMSILLVGISVRAAAESAVRSGYEVQALDVFGDTDLSAACPTLSLMRDFPQLYPDVASQTVRLFLCSTLLDFEEVAYGSGFENHPECVREWEAMGKTILGNESDVLVSIRNWRKLFDFLDSKGIDHPETHIVNDLSKFDLSSLDPDQFIVKPALSGGGHGIRPLAEVAGLPNLPEEWAGRTVLVQRRLEGLLTSASFVSGDEGFRLLSTTLQLVGNAFSPFRYVGNIAPLDAPPGIRRRMEEIARSIATEFDLKGSNGVDFMLVGRQVNVLEVNPRIQGSLEVVERASGVGVFDAHVRASRGQGLPSVGRVPGFWGRRVVYAPADLLTGELGGLEFVKDVPSANMPLRAGAPVCTVLAHSRSSSRCGSLLKQREKRVISLLHQPA